MATASSFPFPREYSFPPFFTRQTNLTTHHAQLELFHNKTLNKRLSLADAREVLEFMRKDGRAEALPASTDVFWVYWRTPDEWAAVIEGWIDDTAQKGVVLTLYELTEGEGTRGTEFHGLDPDLLAKALQILVKRGKAQIFGQEDSQGVKFF
ncbi:vacuolar protein-sorting-associated protein 36 [Colletotrichum spaethianum]|uniref:ESCRT-II complex subunit VPS25 n=1 Tax=Colletotrichum spaethianum TaxID=700344 RepID=A0AA37NYN5_9PEZI|nr:vacuolar protein-sorting-associated protein 36 [Colletotrichum spaethianum]GKT46417.1 vacuolar protein-sorting-associated protein 36 [Colletotrichum spaethianum]